MMTTTCRKLDSSYGSAEASERPLDVPPALREDLRVFCAASDDTKRERIGIRPCAVQDVFLRSVPMSSFFTRLSADSCASGALEVCSSRRRGGSIVRVMATADQRGHRSIDEIVLRSVVSGRNSPARISARGNGEAAGPVVQSRLGSAVRSEWIDPGLMALVNCDYCRT